MACPRTRTKRSRDSTTENGCQFLKRSKHEHLQRCNIRSANTNCNSTSNQVPSLLDIAAKCAAKLYPYQEIEERLGGYIPGPVQNRIIYHSFPENEASIALYSSNRLHTSSTESNKQPFNVGMKLCESDSVKDVIQIGKSFCFRSLLSF